MAAPHSTSPARPAPGPGSGLQAWQVLMGGMCGLVLTVGLARFAYTPLLPTLQAQTGLSDRAAGLLAAVNYAGYMSGALLAAWLDNPRWRHRLYGAGLWLALLSTAAMGLGAWWPGWMALRYLGGLCGASGMLLGSGLVLGWLMRAGRRAELGLFFIGLGLGILVSAGGAWVFTRAWADWRWHWWGLAALGLVFAVPAWRWRPPVPTASPTESRTEALSNARTEPLGDALTEPRPPPVPGLGLSRRWLWTLSASYFAAGWGFVIHATFTVSIVERQPALAGQGALAWALVGVAAMPAVFGWDRVARRVGEWRALLMAFALQIVAVLLPALSGSLAAALCGAVGYGATFIGIVSLTLALVGRRSPANPGRAMARLTLSYGAAQVIAPALTGWMVQASGSFHQALWLTAAVMSAGMAVLATLPRHADDDPHDHRPA